MVLEQAIKAEATRLGFALVGITTPQPPEHYATFLGWLAEGRQAGMGYLATERSLTRRADPQQILPECRSIIVVGLRTPRPQDAQPAPDSGLTGRVAAYAWGEDYHHVIPPRLDQLRGFIEDQLGRPVKALSYTDSGPILERDLAQRAGLGWIGKNTCLIDPHSGSWFLLGELLLDVALEPDQPFTADHCGSCTRCIEACPTGCILPDRTLDAGRCISYLTIELKGAMPLELRPLTGEWVFGCDICQQVCPWNLRFAPADHNGALTAAEASRARPDLIETLKISVEVFRECYRGTPLERAKRRGLLRNVAVALGNCGDPAAIPALIACLESEPEALVRQHAAWALGQLGGLAVRQALESARVKDLDETVRAEAALALETG